MPRKQIEALVAIRFYPRKNVDVAKDKIEQALKGLDIAYKFTVKVVDNEKVDK